MPSIESFEADAPKLEDVLTTVPLLRPHGDKPNAIVRPLQREPPVDEPSTTDDKEKTLAALEAHIIATTNGHGQPRFTSPDITTTTRHRGSRGCSRVVKKRFVNIIGSAQRELWCQVSDFAALLSLSLCLYIYASVRFPWIRCSSRSRCSSLQFRRACFWSRSACKRRPKCRRARCTTTPARLAF